MDLCYPLPFFQMIYEEALPHEHAKGQNRLHHRAGE